MRCAFHLLLLIAVALPAAARPAVPTAAFTVSPQGDDSWSGRLAAPNRRRTDGPFATLARARDAVRDLKAREGLGKGVTVLVRGGTYFLKEPLTFGPEDSGTEKAPITYAACPGEKVFLKGSRPITGWQPFRDRIYRADVAGADLGAGRFWQLYYRENRQPLARYPNEDPEHPRSGGFLYVPAEAERGSKTLLQYNPQRLDPSRWARPAEVRVHIWPWLNWNRNIVPIGSVDRDRQVITLARPASYMISRGNRFFVENALEELDAPGEWFCDEAAKQVYFQPPDGRNPEGQVSVPALPALVRFQGNAARGEFVGHIRLEHFTLSEARDSLVNLAMAEGCAVVGCVLTGCGGTALQTSERSHHNSVLGCDIAHVGGSAIVLNDVVDWDHRAENKLHHNVVSNNHVHDVGEYGDAWGAIMISPACGGNASYANILSHNLVHDTPRQGITFNGMGNVVEFNHVHHTNQEQSDTGAIGMGSRDIYERGSIVRHNYVHDTGGYNMLKPGVWEYPHYCWGIYLDDYTSGVHVYGNLVVNTYLGGVMVHGGQDNVIENNIIVDGAAQQVQFMPIDSRTSGRTPAHPDVSPWLMTGTKLLGNIFYYTRDKAQWAAGSKWQQMLAESDRNVIWHAGRPVALTLPGVADDYWAAWQKMGYDRNSVVADPLFVNAARGDYRLRPNSPALKRGFQPIPFEKIGLYRSPERASWPVSENVRREEHLTLPEGAPPAAPARKETPTLRAARLASPPRIDGRVEPGEWNETAPGAKAPVVELSLEGGKATQPATLLVARDAEALYVALVSRVSNAGKLPRAGGTWGQDDGAEVCLQDVSGKKPGPIFVVQGYPSGKYESVGHAGAPSDLVRRLGESVRYAAAIGDGQWSGEWRIPLAALGVDPAKATKLLFNLGVLKGAEGQWAAWVSTGAAPWRLESAGVLVVGE